MKAPGQTKGKIDDAWVETIDILPTMFDLLNIEPAGRHGRAARRSAPTVRNRDTLTILLRNSFKKLEIPGTEFEADKRAVLEKKLRLFGTGATGRERIYRIGPNQELIGKGANDVPQPGAASVELHLGRRVRQGRHELVDDPDPRGGRGQGRGRRASDVAIAVNGTMRGRRSG